MQRMPQDFHFSPLLIGEFGVTKDSALSASATGDDFSPLLIGEFGVTNMRLSAASSRLIHFSPLLIGEFGVTTLGAARPRETPRETPSIFQSPPHRGIRCDRRRRRRRSCWRRISVPSSSGNSV